MNITSEMVNTLYCSVIKMVSKDVSVDEINWFEFVQWAHEHGAPATSKLLRKGNSDQPKLISSGTHT